MTGTADPRRRRRLGVGAAIVAVLGAVAVTIVVGIVRTSAAPVEQLDVSPPVTAAAAPSASPRAGVYVHVSGAVNAPGLYRLPADARVMDAVAAASGMTAQADRDAVNLARKVTDGEQVRIPLVGEAPVAAPGSGSGPGGGSAPGADTGPVDLNTATLDQLDTLPRIGPSLAQRIIDWREQNGPFHSVDDLLSVPGIGEKLLEGLREKATVS